MYRLPSDPEPSAGGRRVWFLKATAALVIVLNIAIQLWPELERNLKAWAIVGSIQLGLLLVLIWFTFLSRVPWPRRLLTLALLAAFYFGISKVIRTDGAVSGVGLPRLAWKWSKPRELPAASAPMTAGEIAPAADIPDVPQFFGPNRDGIVTGAKLARDWKTRPPKELWRQPIGEGWSAFSVAGGRAFTQEQRGENEAVSCYDVRTGKLIWMHQNAARFQEWQGGDGPRATPTVFEGRVYAYGATGILDCLDAKTGHCYWTRRVLQELDRPNLKWAVSSSPLVFEDTVIVSGGDNGASGRGPALVAFRRSTGEPLWRAGEDSAAYSSPILTTLAGRRVVLSVNGSSVTAHDPKSGAVLFTQAWTEEHIPKGAQPVVLAGDRVFVSAGYGKGCMLLQIAANSDGSLTATQVWKSMRMKNQFNSVAVRDGFFYGLDDGMLACVATDSGERKWKGGRFGSGQTLLVDDLILIQSEPGAIVLAEAKPDGFNELGRLEALNSKTWNHPVLAGRYLLVRNDREAICFELPTL